jgi:Outer membrane phospholipase A
MRKSQYSILPLIIIVILSACPNLYAQNLESKENESKKTSSSKADWKKPNYRQINQSEIIKNFEKEPSFGIFHDNYFTTGVPTNKEVNKSTADIKFQISIRQLLFKNLLPRNQILALTYTQKSFWNIYEKSAPFADNNYNPGLSLSRPITHNGALIGFTSIAFEHESNGKDSLDNRSCNYFVWSGVYLFSDQFSAQVKIWGGWLADENKDLYSKYRGYGLMAINYRSQKDKIWCSVVINPRNRFKSFNTQMEINYKPNSNSNQYLFLQWYNGYGESLLEYDQYTSMIRVGICLKPSLRNFY